MLLTRMWRFVNYLNGNSGFFDCLVIMTTVKNEKWMELKFDNRRYVGVEDIRIFDDIQTNDL